LQTQFSFWYIIINSTQQICILEVKIVAQPVKKFRASLTLEDLLSCSEGPATVPAAAPAAVPAAVPAASQSNTFHSFVMHSFKLYF
jgi:hypothetical protein